MCLESYWAKEGVMEMWMRFVDICFFFAAFSSACFHDLFLYILFWLVQTIILSEQQRLNESKKDISMIFMCIEDPVRNEQN